MVPIECRPFFIFLNWKYVSRFWKWEFNFQHQLKHATWNQHVGWHNDAHTCATLCGTMNMNIDGYTPVAYTRDRIRSAVSAAMYCQLHCTASFSVQTIAVHFIVWCNINRCVTIERHGRCIALHWQMQSWRNCKPHGNCSELTNKVAYRMQCTTGCNDQPSSVQWWMQCATVSHIECAPGAISLCAWGEPLRCGLDMETALQHAIRRCHQRPS